MRIRQANKILKRWGEQSYKRRDRMRVKSRTAAQVFYARRNRSRKK